mgnify:CR=1 FL=1
MNIESSHVFRSLNGKEHSSPWGSSSPAPLVEGLANKFVTTCSVHLTVDLRVPQLPKEGRHLRAASAVSSPGGGYVVAAAARAQGVESWIASPLGTGPNSHEIRRRMAFDDIRTFASAVVGDVGVAVSMVEEDGKTASVIAPGVEAEVSPLLLKSISLNPGDVVHICGGDLVGEAQGKALSEWGANLPDGVIVVLAISPAVEMVPAKTWLRLLRRADIVTMNIREAQTIRNILAQETPPVGLRQVMRPEAALVRRTGPMGCELQRTMGAPNIQLPAYPSRLVDTTGVGDTHIAVMCAALLKGCDLEEACRHANAAGAIAVGHPTAFPVPTEEAIDSVIEKGHLGTAP